MLGKSFSVILIQGLTTIFSYLFTFYLTNYHGAYQFGLYSLGFSSFTLLLFLSKMGIDVAMIKLITHKTGKLVDPEDQKIISTSFTTVIVMSMVISLVIYCMSNFLANEVFHEPRIEEYLIYFSCSLVPLVIIHLIAELFRSQKIVLYHSLLKFLMQPLFFIILALILYFSGIVEYETFNIAYIYFFGSLGVLLCAIGLLIYSKVLQDVGFQYTFDKATFKKVFTISTPMLISNFALMAITFSSYFILSLYQSPEEVSKLRIIVRLSMLGMIILTSINAVTGPVFSKQYANNNLSGLKKSINSATGMIYILSIPLYIGLVVFAPFILKLFGKDFEGLQSYLIVIVIGKLFNCLTGPVAMLLNMTNGQKQVALVMFTSLVFSVISMLFLVRTYDLMGAAISLTGTIFFTNTILYILVYKKFGYFVLPNIKGSLDLVLRKK